MSSATFVTRADKSALADAVASRFIEVVAPLTEARDVHVSLTGGSMGIASLAAIAGHDDLRTVDWSRVHFWFSDERFVARVDGDRNTLQARAALLDALPDAHVHEPWSTEDGDLDDAALAYASELERFAAADASAPAFDVTFLGVGPDAHIASLFPGRDEIHVESATVLPIRESPKPPSERVTFTLPIINASERVWLVVAGSDKSEAIALIRAGADPETAPAAAARGAAETIVFADDAAAAAASTDS